jgi:hypothetical protein
MAGDQITTSDGTAGYTFYPSSWPGGTIQYVPPPSNAIYPPAPTYQFNIVILANGQKLPLDSDELATKIGHAIAAAFQTKEDQHTLEDLAE